MEGASKGQTVMRGREENCGARAEGRHQDVTDIQVFRIIPKPTNHTSVTSPGPPDMSRDVIDACWSDNWKVIWRRSGLAN
jgi:hypothetical protein